MITKSLAIKNIRLSLQSCPITTREGHTCNLVISVRLWDFHLIQLSEVFNTVSSGSLKLLFPEICLKWWFLAETVNITETADLVFREGSPKLSHLSRAQPHLYLRPERPVVGAALRLERNNQTSSSPPLLTTPRLALQWQENMKALLMIFSLSALEWLRWCWP